MIYSNSMKALPVFNQNVVTNLVPVSSNLFGINITNYQPINSIYSNNPAPKNDMVLLLTDQNIQYKNITPSPYVLPNSSIYGKEIINTSIKHSSSLTRYHSQVKIIKQRKSWLFNQTFVSNKNQKTNRNFKPKLNSENIYIHKTSKNHKPNGKPPKLYKKTISKSAKNTKNKKRTGDITNDNILQP